MDNETGDFVLKLLGAFGGLTALILGALSFLKDKMKLKIEDDTVKRKEVSVLLQQLYDDTQTELREQRITHAKELEAQRVIHREELALARAELNEAKKSNSEEIGKRDIIIQELISRLPRESREVIEAKIDEMGLKDIINKEITK